LAKTAAEILAEELGKLAARAGKDEAGELGQGVVRWVARRMPNNAFSLTLHFAADAARVLRAGAEVLAAEGQLQEVARAASEAPAVAAVVPSGFLGLNPALVTIEVLPQDGQQVVVNVSGLAKEGLIKQHAGEKAARRIADRLQAMFPPAG
jgi:hypothetical protein